MKDYTDVAIICRCSARMHCKGKHFQQYKDSPIDRTCPNCGKVHLVRAASIL